LGDASWGKQRRSYVLAPYQVESLENSLLMVQLVKDTETGVQSSRVEAVLNGEIDSSIFLVSHSRRRFVEESSIQTISNLNLTLRCSVRI
jgi:protein subunit release factor B